MPFTSFPLDAQSGNSADQEQRQRDTGADQEQRQRDTGESSTLRAYFSGLVQVFLYYFRGSLVEMNRTDIWTKALVGICMSLFMCSFAYFFADSDNFEDLKSYLYLTGVFVGTPFTILILRLCYTCLDETSIARYLEIIESNERTDAEGANSNERTDAEGANQSPPSCECIREPDDHVNEEVGFGSKENPSSLEQLPSSDCEELLQQPQT